ncbi:CLUMA_CG013011, isoform A [Clunio marinus]|uniref:CLUMA_CG013011, isoform A n=1 Tax=Clunio marinus TaxID=568069 RepID=A0A1J1IJK5_9DIPT|nr:CLUMA_CG013011, isoform A [Clunio marinus]
MNHDNHHDKETIKKFNFVSKDRKESYEILIAELMVGAYSFYTWPAAKILAQFIFYMRQCLVGKNILEIGAGTSLPGILAAKIGSNVTLSDSALLPKSLAHIDRICNLNKLKPGKDVQVVGLTWGMLGNDFYDLGNDLDLIIGSDCLYDIGIFEEVISSVAFLLEHNLKATFICSYQSRSSDWSIENLLKKWNLACRNIDLESIGKETGVDMKDLMGGHVIYLLEFYRKH